MRRNAHGHFYFDLPTVPLTMPGVIRHPTFSLIVQWDTKHQCNAMTKTIIMTMEKALFLFDNIDMYGGLPYQWLVFDSHWALKTFFNLYTVQSEIHIS